MNGKPSFTCGQCLHTCMFRDKIAQAKRLGKSITLKQSGNSTLLFAHKAEEQPLPDHWVGCFRDLNIKCIQETINEYTSR